MNYEKKQTEILGLCGFALYIHSKTHESLQGSLEKVRGVAATLTILPRLNSLNHDPGFSLGQEDILTYIKRTNCFVNTDPVNISATEANRDTLN